MRRRIRSAAPIPFHRHMLPQILVDGVLVAFAYYLAFQLRFDEGLPHHYVLLLERTIWWVALGGVIVLVLSRVYLRSWSFAGQRDYEAILRGVLAIVVLAVVGVAVVRPVQIPYGPYHHGRPAGTNAVQLPLGVIALFGLLALAALVGVRVLARAAYERRLPGGLRGVRDGERGVLIVGAGEGGRLVLREMLRNRELGLTPVGFLDDDPRKRGMRVDGVKVRGNTEGDLPRILEEAEPEEVIIAIPSAPGSTRARVVRECRARAIPVRTLPTVFELLRDGSPGRAGAGSSPTHPGVAAGAIARQVREVRVEDVLGREPVLMELDRVGAYLAREAVVLVSGAGGSIGAELCRQIAHVGPRRLVLLDHAEDNLFAIERELLEERHVAPGALAAVLGDCKEEERMREVLAEHRPTVVFHAAAYKHVGLMEANPVEAVRNNAIATRVMAHVAGELGVARFVLVSTDKAVAPATVMGASKALAELALEAAAARWPDTVYRAVRFGNVLGSSGSVVPIFRRQIARGGPVTVTDRRMTRYFMTIPEAVQLIIRAGSLPQSPPTAEVLVLDMGDPVRIMDLARAMIELSGLDPDRDIEIEEVGPRPGEKLHEELFNEYERPQPTATEKIMRAERRPLAPDVVEEVFAEVNLLVLEGDAAGLAAKVADLTARVRRSVPAVPVPAGASSAPVPLIHSDGE
ncbi:MAG TPA: nucleoside-diphosphate sugar epimerase/dehydratase [Solirubrobacteraceae bacterium]|jgi:FlaA1/EpsC-like NDP-sugar epimerase|nr:nucleoside-diphosphate sugar epimerase/dehydratase [Solirubrobacteraceae bacterium]